MFRNKFQIGFLAACAVLILTLAGCSDDESTPTAPQGPQAEQCTITQSIKEVGQFFDFSTGETTEALSPISSWDVAFQNKAMGGLGIALNFGRGGQALNTGRTDFDAVSIADTTGKTFVLDAPWTDPSAVAIDDWFDMAQMGKIESRKHVYILALKEGTGIAYTKFQMLGYADSKYTFQFASLPDGATTTGEAAMGGDTHWLYYSFATSALASFEPSADGWDLYFGPVVAPMGTMLIAIGRILPNVESGVRIATAEDVALDALTVVDWAGGVEDVYVLKDWYKYDHDAKAYTYPLKSFLATTAEGLYAGFQILSYQSAGKSGYPTFVYKYDMQ